MELRDYGRALRRRWRILVALIVLGGAAGLAVSLLLPKTYQAQTELFVAPASGASSIELVQGSTFVLNRVKSYVEVVDTDVVLGPVINQLGLDTTVSDLADQVSAVVIPDTVVVSISVADGSAEQAARIANAVAKQFVQVAPTLEPPGRANAAVIKISVINSASVPTAAASPVLRFNVGLGVLVGLAVGLAAALARDAMDPSVRSARQIAVASSAPVLAHVPDGVALTSWADAKANAGRESIRELRATLQTQLIDQGKHSCLITSAVSGEGRTTVARGLALAFAETGRRVCLVEADLRQPGLASVFGWKNQSGLTESLAESGSWSNSVRRTEQGGFDVLVAGSKKLAGQPLATAEARELFTELGAGYDMVLVDSPPLLESAAAQDLAGCCDAVVLVVGGGPRPVTQAQLDEAVERIEAVQGSLSGFVTNRLPLGG